MAGGSRGVGAATALAFAERSFNVALTYRNKASRAASVEERIESRGARALNMRVDITKPDQGRRLRTMVLAWSGHLDVLVLNASGGPERDMVERNQAYR